MKQSIVNGATLLGTGLACLGLRQTFGWGWFGFGVMTGAGIILMLLGAYVVWAKE